VVRSVTEETAAMRTDPPPTAAIVPLVMVAAAIAASWVVQRVMLSGPAGAGTVRSRSVAD
nr:hypothetical protein [Chloroflexota bacterium]